MQQVILSKIESIERCLKRIRSKDVAGLFGADDADIQDVIVLNLQRACQMSIDLAMYISAELGYGIPQNSADAFRKLFEHGVISEDLFERMKKMTAFRNIAVHQYQSINYAIVKSIVTQRLDDFYEFNAAIIGKYVSST